MVGLLGVEENTTTTHANLRGEALLHFVDVTLDGGVLGDELEEVNGFLGEMAVVSSRDGGELVPLVLAELEVLAFLGLLHLFKVVFHGVGGVGRSSAVADGDVEDVDLAVDGASDVGAGGRES